MMAEMAPGQNPWEKRTNIILCLVALSLGVVVLTPRVIVPAARFIAGNFAWRLGSTGPGRIAS